MLIKEIDEKHYYHLTKTYPLHESLHFFQTRGHIEWLKYDGLRDRGFRFFLVSGEGKPKAIFLVYQRNDTRASYHTIKYYLPVYAADHFPLFFEEVQMNEMEGILRAIINFIKNKLGSTELGVRFNINPIINCKYLNKDLIKGIIADMGLKGNETATIILDLTKFASTQSIWENIDGKARTKVRKAEKLGIKVRLYEVSIPGQELEHHLKDFGFVFSENRKRLRLPPPRVLYEEYANLLKAEGGMLKYIFAFSEFEDRLISAQQGLITNSSVVVLQGVSISNFGFESKLPGNDLVQWDVIKHCYEQGYKYIDWGGYILHPVDEKELSINRYKEKWGGEVYESSIFFFKKPWVPLKVIL